VTAAASADAGGDDDLGGSEEEAAVGSAVGYWRGATRETSHEFEVDYTELEFQEKIGEGAFAEVWRGSWLQGPVAIKRFRAQLVLSDGGGGSGGDGPVEDCLEEDEEKHLVAQTEFLRGRAPSDDRLMRYASTILSDDNGGRLSRRVTQSVLRRFMSDSSRENYVAFLNEVKFMSRLRHPNVMMYMGAVVNPRFPLCIVSELFRGGSLHDYLHTDRAFRPPRRVALRIALEIARGMNYLHSRAPPFLHRDLKPRNVLLSSAQDAEPHVVICDFGLCKLFGDDDEPKGGGLGVVGTASYMSPNVIDGRGEYTTADDVFSFALVLWEIATGRVPFEGMRPIQVIFNVSEDGLRPAIRAEDDLSPALDALITDCWQERPGARPTFGEVTARLDAILAALEAGKDEELSALVAQATYRPTASESWATNLVGGPGDLDPLRRTRAAT
jgi:serine/threonine protein kinase